MAVTGGAFHAAGATVVHGVMWVNQDDLGVSQLHLRGDSVGDREHVEARLLSQAVEQERIADGVVRRSFAAVGANNEVPLSALKVALHDDPVRISDVVRRVREDLGQEDPSFRTASLHDEAVAGLRPERWRSSRDSRQPRCEVPPRRDLSSSCLFRRHGELSKTLDGADAVAVEILGLSTRSVWWVRSRWLRPLESSAGLMVVIASAPSRPKASAVSLFLPSRADSQRDTGRPRLETSRGRPDGYSDQLQPEVLPQPSQT